MSQINPHQFIEHIPGTIYILPEYKVTDGVGLERDDTDCIISFVRGSKLGTETVEKNTGITHEALLSMMIHDLKYKNGLVPSEETSNTIKHLEAALDSMNQRQQRRKQEVTQGTYQK